MGPKGPAAGKGLRVELRRGCGLVGGWLGDQLGDRLEGACRSGLRLRGRRRRLRWR